MLVMVLGRCDDIQPLLQILVFLATLWRPRAFLNTILTFSFQFLTPLSSISTITVVYMIQLGNAFSVKRVFLSELSNLSMTKSIVIYESLVLVTVFFDCSLFNQPVKAHKAAFTRVTISRGIFFPSLPTTSTSA